MPAAKATFGGSLGQGDSWILQVSARLRALGRSLTAFLFLRLILEAAGRLDFSLTSDRVNPWFVVGQQ